MCSILKRKSPNAPPPPSHKTLPFPPHACIAKPTETRKRLSNQRFQHFLSPQISFSTRPDNPQSQLKFKS
jgi:hypothetical protein